MMDSYLSALRSKRAEVQAAINAEYLRPYPDAVVLAQLKKRKLRLREKIERIEGKSSLSGLAFCPTPSAAARAFCARLPPLPGASGFGRPDALF
jgi:hypothetical protein